MVQSNHQDVLVRCQAQQRQAQQRAALQVKRLAHLLIDQAQGCLPQGFTGQALQLRPRLQIDHRQAKRGRRLDHLQRSTIDRHKNRAQAFMAADDLAQAVLQCGDVQRPLKIQGHGNVVRRALPVQLGQVPQALLSKRQRQQALARHRPDWSESNLRRPLQFIQAQGQLRHGRGIEQAAQRQVHAAKLTQPGDHPHDQQRVPAQLEEVILGANRFQAQRLGPYPRHELLAGAARRHKAATLTGLRWLYRVTRPGQGGIARLPALKQRGRFCLSRPGQVGHQAIHPARHPGQDGLQVVQQAPHAFLGPRAAPKALAVIIHRQAQLAPRLDHQRQRVVGLF